ncbi:hypothetical protein SVAN01_02924 [Stagonosporopsis vannaccii]|nr:hypothetical protein SVAN01_02924 [Stagonosporopsis vannaccii]
MGRLQHRSSSPNAEPYGYGNSSNSNGHAHNCAAGIQIIQYRSYQRDILIYHVHEHLVSLLPIRKALQSQKSYHDKLVSFDPIRYYTVIEGDEIPTGCIEAAYMPSILHGNGSALALRSNKKAGKVEWFVFRGPIHETFLSQIILFGNNWVLQSDLNPDDPRKVFNLVGYAEKGLKTRRVRGANAEHKGWHDSLCSGEQEKVSVKFTWKEYGNELKAEQERRRQEAEEVGEELWLDAEDDPRKVVHAWKPPQPLQKPVVRHKL